MDKSAARERAKAAVAAMSAKEKFAASAEITQSFTDYIKDFDVKSAFVYMSVAGEVSTVALMTAFLAAGIKVYIPKVAGDDMLVTEVTYQTSFALNKFGIPEAPNCGEEFFDADVNVIPLVAFDKNRNRVGHGKGYYDKYLIKTTGKKIAFAFSAQEVDEIDAADDDVKPDAIITEKGII